MFYLIPDTELLDTSIDEANRLNFDNRVRWVDMHNRELVLYYINPYGDIMIKPCVNTADTK